MNAWRLWAALILSAALCCALQASKTYRECRNFYGYDRGFCAHVVLP